MKFKKTILLVILIMTGNLYAQTQSQKLGKATIDYVDAIAWARGLKDSKCGKFERNENELWKNTALAIEYAIKNEEKYTTPREREIMKKDLQDLLKYSQKQNFDFYNSLPLSDCEMVVKQFQNEYAKRITTYKSLLN